MFYFSRIYIILYYIILSIHILPHPFSHMNVNKLPTFLHFCSLIYVIKPSNSISPTISTMQIPLFFLNCIYSANSEFTPSPHPPPPSKMFFLFDTVFYANPNPFLKWMYTKYKNVYASYNNLANFWWLSFYISTSNLYTLSLDNLIFTFFVLHVHVLYYIIKHQSPHSSGVSRVWQVGHVSWAPLRGFSA